MPIIDSGAISLFEWQKASGVAGAKASDSNNTRESSEPDKRPTFADVAAQVASEKPAGAAPVEKPPAANGPFKIWEKDQLGFGDFVDIINPLQHIPVISTLYRHWTGDQIGAAPRIVGGALWGRAGGFIAGVINSVVQFVTGKDIGDHIYNALFEPAKSATAVAARSASPANIANQNTVPSMIGGPGSLDNPDAELLTITQVPGSQSSLHGVEHGLGIMSEMGAEVSGSYAIPWPAASALHIFQTHERSANRDKETQPSLVRHIA